MRTHYKTIVLSDIHLGSEYSKTKEVIKFLRHVDCDRLILNGDIIDGWQIRKTCRHWKKEHTDLIKILMKMMEHCQTQIIYVRGNHDDFLDRLIPLNLANVKIVPNYMFRSYDKVYFVTHGDVFDTVTSNFRWLATIGDWGYTLLLHINKYYNKYRRWIGKPYYSLSQNVKHRVKSAVNYISDFRNELVNLAKSKNYDGIICGHIHQPANEIIDGIHYLNSGDWVESMTALVEDENGIWSVETYDEERYGTGALVVEEEFFNYMVDEAI